MNFRVVGVLLAGLLTLSQAVFADQLRPMPRDLGGIQVAQNSAAFENWKNAFRAKALRAGISGKVFDTAFKGVQLNTEVLRLDGKQAEFTKPIWEYLDTAVSDARIITGRGNAKQMERTVKAIERRYKVEAEVFLAIWGMETNYGTFRGNIGVIEALASLAYQGRRRSFGEEQLIAALKIIQSGDVAPSQMRGSWAGAMGHTQFIPTSYLSYAQDFNRDGRRDVWAEDPTDALASTAHYLRKFGWQKGQPWGVEVTLPRGFNYTYADGKTKRPISAWNQLGIKQASGGKLRNYGNAALLAPAGARGPIFLVFKNFEVIKRYNNATSYAIGVGHLAARIAGAPDFRASWPRGDRALSRTEKIEMQKRLSAKGFGTGKVDGLIGPNTMEAIRKYQRSQGVTPDGYASARLLTRLRSK